MRIVQLLTRPQRRGAEIFALQLSELLKKLGHEVLVITLLRGEGEISYSGKLVQLQRPENRLLDGLGFWRLSQILDEFKPDLVQANASDTLRYGVGAKFFSRSKFRLVYRNANLMSPFVKNRWTKNFYKFLLSQTDGVISVAEAARVDLIDFYGYAKPTVLVPIGIDGSEIELLASTEISLDLPPNFLLFMGGLVPEKDPEFLLEWFVTYHTQWPDLHLIFLGKGILEARLIKIIHQLGLGEKVKLIPNQANPFPILKKAKALVLPSKIEGLPAVILEAMYCRVPVIAYGVGGIPEVLQHGETGWCITPGDQEEFAQAILEVMGMDESAKIQILNRAFELVNSQFTLPQLTDKFQTFYSSLLSPPSSDS
jgi:glycosyltransferase involved in cell wall biosynthesis